VSRSVLAVNAGSSSLKLGLFDEGMRCVWKEEIERIGHEGPADHREALSAGLDRLAAAGHPPPWAVGHRVVHGGPRHAAPERVTDGLLSDLHAMRGFAPLHLPAQIAVIEEVVARLPDGVQVACFDTAFHRDMPERARRLPLPGDVWDEGVRRYGFHGLSYEYVVAEVPEASQGRVVIAHLGNGASMSAVLDGHAMDTTMGFTPLGGLMMGTRPGDLDPGVVVYLARKRGLDPDQLEHLLARECGLLGVSGMSSDMKALLDARETHAGAALAVEMFCYRARKEIGALAAALGGLDTLIFTGGIGERAVAVRDEICAGLDHLGPPNVMVVATDEALVIARHTRRQLTLA
jgi:acetate kinase